MQSIQGITQGLQALAMDIPTDLDHFHCFNNLPIELRLDIWKVALPEVPDELSIKLKSEVSAGVMKVRLQTPLSLVMVE